jgi:hypothetical protein
MGQCRSRFGRHVFGWRTSRGKLTDSGPKLKYADITISFGPRLTKRFYQIVQDFPAGRNAPHSGGIVTFNELYREISRLTFSGGRITELGVPALKRGSVGIPGLSINISPAAVRRSYTPDGIPFPEASSPLTVDGHSFQTLSLIIKLYPLRLHIPGAKELFNLQEDFIVRGHYNDAERKDGTYTCCYLPVGGPRQTQEQKPILVRTFGIFGLKTTVFATCKEIEGDSETITAVGGD